MRVSELKGRVIIWRRMTKKMTQKTGTVTSMPEVHLKVGFGNEISWSQKMQNFVLILPL